MGCVVEKLLGARGHAPAFVDLNQGRPLVRNSARPGFLGPAYRPFRPDISHLFKRELEEGMKGELARLGKDHQVSLKLLPDLKASRLDDRVGAINLPGFPRPPEYVVSRTSGSPFSSGR